MTNTKYTDFYFRGTRAIYTLPGHHTEKVIREAFSALSSVSAQLKAYSEIGKDGYEHTHVVVLYCKRTEISSSKKWSVFAKTFGGFNKKDIKTDEHMKNAVHYENATKKGGKASKSVTIFDDIGDWKPKEDYHHTVIKFIQNAQSWSEVITDPQHSKYIMQAMTWAHDVYSNARSTADFEFCSGKALDWQQQFIDLLSTPADRRTVHWVYDDLGGNGKSDLANWLLSHRSAFLCDVGAQKDIAYAYDNQPIVIFDLSRDSQEYTPYKVMEAFKNGRMFSAKYRSKLKVFKPPHVVVFANYKPDCKHANPEAEKARLSADRWDLLTLQNFQLNKSPRGVPTNVKDPPGKVAKPLQPERKRRRRSKKTPLKTYKPFPKGTPKRHFSTKQKWLDAVSKAKKAARSKKAKESAQTHS